MSDAVTAFADAAKEVADSLAEVDDRYDVGQITSRIGLKQDATIFDKEYEI